MRVRSFNNCSTLNSRPRKHSKKTMPSSARTSMNSLWSTRVSGIPAMPVSAIPTSRSDTAGRLGGRGDVAFGSVSPATSARSASCSSLRPTATRMFPVSRTVSGSGFSRFSQRRTDDDSNT